MGISGKYVKTFEEANLASCTGVSMDANYPHCFFDVKSMTPDMVVLVSHNGGEKFTFPIKKDRHTEYAIIEQKSSFEHIFNRKPTKFEIRPFKGERS